MIQNTKKTEKFLGQNIIPAFIGGKWKLSNSERVSKIENPADQSILARVSKPTADEAAEAIEAADKAFQSWKRLGAVERAKILNKFADLCERDGEELAQLEALDVGKSIQNARGFDVPFGIDSLRYYTNLIQTESFEKELNIEGMNSKKVRLPFGVVGFIFPWNFPLTLCMWGIGPALAAGNTVVVKPSEITPLSTLYLGVLAKEAGIPEGVLNILPGSGSEIGHVLTSHPKVKCVSFTGSSPIGKIIGQNCGFNLKPVKLELGGKGAAVVFEDANIDATAKGLADAITLNTGQVCCTATRWIVQESVADEFIDKVKKQLLSTIIAPGMTEECEMGPVVSKKQLDSILNYIEKGKQEGAKVLLGGKRIQKDGLEIGYYLEPTLLFGTDENICFKEEIFGPVAFISTFKDENDAINQVNSIDYGLANSVWTEDKLRADRVAKEMVAGSSWINAHNVFAYGLAYGGVNGSGSGGGVNSIDTLFDYTRILSIAEPVLQEL